MKKGFSLVELSIVLVILGLLTGGILAGQNLIRAAELRTITTEFAGYSTALNTFRDKYFAIPGDMRNATNFWGDNASVCTDATITDGTPGTCNGNGDGIIEAGAPNGTAERLQFWNQLALAGLIEGSYTGVTGSTNTADSTPGVNIPRSRINSSGWFTNNNSGAAASVYTTVNYGNSLVFGTADANSWPFKPALRPEEAWNIDTKMDDGRPAYGKVVARFWDDECASADDGGSAANDPEASYRLTDNSILCAFIFPRVY